MKKDDWTWEGMQTRAIHADEEANRTRAVTPPIWQTTNFAYDSAEEFADVASQNNPAEFYTRYGNPTHKGAEAVMAQLEGGETALVTSSGMGAIFAVLASLLQSGDHLVAQTSHYAGAVTLLRDLLPRWNIECTFVEQIDVEAFARAVRPNTKVIYLESPTNPLMKLTDLRAVAAVAQAHDLTTIVDSTFATPINQQPLRLGIDVVVHSATKFLGGHHDLTAGVIVGSRSFIEEAWTFAHVFGASLSPFEAWLLLRGLRTLGLRVERHNRNALALARFLEAHPKVARVYYPGLASHPQHSLAQKQMSGFTGMLSVELGGGYSAATRFIERLKLAANASSLGGVGTLAVHPAAMWRLNLTPDERRAAGIADGLVRLSIGLEDEADLLRDFAQALEQVG